MLRRVCLMWGIVVALGGAAVVFGAPDSSLPAHRDGIVLLKFRSGTGTGVQALAFASVGGSVVKVLGSGVYMLNVGNGKVAAALATLKSRSETLYVEPDFATLPLDDIRASGGQSAPTGAAGTFAATATALPNDLYVSSQWAVLNTGQSVNGSTGTSGADERAAPAWSVTTGTNSVVVAVLDSGVQYSHPDLLTNMWSNPGGVGGCAAGTHGYNVLTKGCDPMDDDTAYGGHGTHVAGILGAVGNNAAGVAGVNWTTLIMAVKWVDASDNGFTSDLISAMDWVIQAKQAGVNVRIVNDSQTWPGTAVSQALSDEIDLLGSNDILFVSAAGNTSQNNDSVPRYPCSYQRPTMICAAATDQNDNLASFSNFGTASVQLAAPGNNILSTLRQSDFDYISGCSMSAAQVSGAAALILSRGNLTVANLRSTILANVDPLASLKSAVGTGGRLNVCKAVPGCAGATTGTPVNSALPVTTGTAQYGSVLGSSTGTWSGLPTKYTYQWLRCASNGSNCVPISGATSQSYAPLAQADIGAELTVVVTASNSAGSASAQSGASAVIASAASPFAISSTIQDGQTISGSVTWQATPGHTSNFVQFYIDGVLSQTISTSPYLYNQGTTGRLDTTQLSNGTHVLGLRALSTDNRTYGFYGATVTVGSAPVNTAVPVISGTPAVGQTLSTSNGTWTNSPTGFAYQWQHCNTSGASCSAISGATGNTYTVTSADVGFTLRSSVTATNSAGSTSAASAPTITIAGSVSITTTSLANGVQNTAYTASLAASGGATPYQWSVISGSLPTNLILNAASGAISGTPTATGTFNFTVQVKDANQQTASKPLSITITAGTGGSGVALVQSNSIQGSSVTSVAAGFANSNTAGNLIVAFVRMSSTTQTVTISDTAGNTYAQAAAQTQTADGHQARIFYAKNIAGGANTVTATFSGSNGHPWLAIYEYSGLSTSSPLDQTASAQGSSSTPNSGATAQTSAAGELLFVGLGLPSSFTGTVAAGSGFTLAQQNTTTSRAASETSIASATGTYSGSFTLSAAANWSAVIATFSPSGSIAPPPTISTSSLPNGVQNTAYSSTLAASGGATPYQWSVISGSLPTNLTLNAASGAISGTPTATGTFNFTVQVKDANQQTASKPLSIIITAGTGGGGIALVQSNSTQGSSVTSIAAGFANSNAAGNLIVAFVRMSSTTQTVTISDTAGNTYVQAAAQTQTADGHQARIFYAKNIAGGANTVTATFSGSNGHPWLAIYEYSGLSTSSPLDQTASAQGSSSTPNSGATAQTSAAGELLFVGLGLPSSFTGTVAAGSGFTLAQQNTTTSRAASETSIASAMGTYSGSFTLSTAANWSAVIATFR